MQRQAISRRSKDGLTVFALRSGFLGDVLMSTAAISAVRESYPSSTIVYATWDVSKPILEMNSDIDHVLPVGAYRLKDFDVHVDIRHELLMHEHSLEHDTPLQTYWGELHFDQFARVLPDLKRPDDFRPELWIAPEDFERMSRDSDKPLVVVNVWSKNGINWRLWSMEKWFGLISLLRQNGCVVVQLCGPDDPEVPGVNLALRLPMRQSIGVMTHADFIIGIDSFLMHAAGARIYDYQSRVLIKDGVPGILLTGPIDSVNVVPAGSPVTPYLAASVHCPDKAPCGHSFATQDLPFCEHRNACMQNLEVEEIWELSKSLLKLSERTSMLSMVHG
jgi:hypothetical protein